MIKLHKNEIALRQIEVAIDLFFNKGDFLAVINLAGAAEEILGCFIKRKNKTDEFSEKPMYDKLVELSTKLVGERSWAIVNKEINGARNAIKHANDDSEDVIEIEKNADIAMLSRAIANYVLLNGGDSATPQMLRVFEYLKVQDFG